MLPIVERAIRYYRREGFVTTAKLAAIYSGVTLYHRRLGLDSYNKNGINIFDQDWDNLILLDACRHDFFSEYKSEFNNEIQSVESRGAATREFITANFQGSYPDLVIVSANGWYIKSSDSINLECHRIYDCWDNKPSADQVTKAAKVASERHPNKRLLIHYIPPHHPFVGETAKQILPDYQSQLNEAIFERIRRGDIDVTQEQIHQCYREEVERAVEHATDLLEQIPGKTVISSDHGEMLGEKADPFPMSWYGHMPGLYTDELVTVPWVESENGERKSIEEGSTRSRINREFIREDREEDTINERLRDLGYKV